MPLQYEEALDFAVACAGKAGVLMRDAFDNRRYDIRVKRDKSFVTKTDEAINALVIERVKEMFPAHGVLGEEASVNETAADLWVCDPIDGTKGFILGIPTAMFSLAYIVDGKAVVGVAYNPFIERLYTGIKGQGAYCNNSRLSVNDDSLAAGAVVATCTNWADLLKRQELYNRLERQGVHIEAVSGAVNKLMLVAAGSFAGYAEPRLHAHDIAAAKVILEEAGGKLTLLDGSEPDFTKDMRSVLATNGKVHDEMLAICKEVAL